MQLVEETSTLSTMTLQDDWFVKQILENLEYELDMIVSLIKRLYFPWLDMTVDIRLEGGNFRSDVIDDDKFFNSLIYCLAPRTTKIDRGISRL